VSRPLILVPDFLIRDPVLFSPIKNTLDPFAEIVGYERSSPESLSTILPEAVGAIGSRFAHEDMLSIAEKLRVIACYGVGYDTCDVDAASNHQVYLTHTPNVLTDAVADHIFGILLAVLRRIVNLDRFVRTSWITEKEWQQPLSYDLRGKTLGIIGFGRIGSALTPRAKGFGMRVIYHDEKHTECMRKMEEEYNVQRKSLEGVLKESDFISINVDLNPKSQDLIKEKELRTMKKTAYLINTSRGLVVDQDALVRILSEGDISGAALDVFEKEPIPSNHPLLKLNNVVLTPHVGSATIEARTGMAKCNAENILAVIKGDTPPPDLVPEQEGMIFHQ
jgi:glyoxylate reductase